jgi:16S rRNA (cytosine967-C5)-methyltransferase
VGKFINISNVVKNLVTEVILNGRPLDKSIESFFKHTSGLSESDKETVYRLFTFIIRYWLPIHGIYKTQFTSRHIDFNEILHIQHILERFYAGKLVCKGEYEKRVLENFKSIENSIHLKESYPEWLFNAIVQETKGLGEQLVRCLNATPVSVLRANTLKISRDELKNRFTSKGKSLAEVEGYPDALKLDKHFDLFKSDEFHSGLFEMQDAGSQAIAPFLQAEPGMRVIDACAGNGGKTLHLSSIMANKGRIIALDTASHKLEVLKRRMNRAGAFNIETRHIDSSKVIKRLHNSADRLLLDIPCSGTGVLKRNPDIKYHLSEEKLAKLKELQHDILDKYSSLVTLNGIIVYSTCSVLESENQQQITRFLNEKQGSFELVAEKSISPLDGFDGFYMARLKRIN